MQQEGIVFLQTERAILFHSTREKNKNGANLFSLGLNWKPAPRMAAGSNFVRCNNLFDFNIMYVFSSLRR